MKRNRYFNAAGKPVSRARYYTERDRLYADNAELARHKPGTMISHVCAVEYWDEGLFFLVDKMLPGYTIYDYARTHYRAYIHARHNR